MTINEELIKVMELVDADPVLDEEAKAVVKDLVEAVAVEPTPANLKVLRTVLSKMADGHRFISALTTMTSE